jgi:hypothetical protein
MKFADRIEGDYRIYGGAFEAPESGYLAAVVVLKVRGVPALVFQDDCLSCGHRFETAEAALRHALERGQRALRELGCPPASAAPQPQPQQQSVSRVGSALSRAVQFGTGLAPRRMASQG